MSTVSVVTLLSLMTKVLGSPDTKNVTPFAESLFGSYVRKPGVATKAILGPIAYNFLPGMNVLRDPNTDDVWFTLLAGQMWHVTGNETQYCFGPTSTKKLGEQSPFSVESITDTSVNFCWRRGLRGMPTHTKGCSGCDCARILLNLTDANTLQFQFWMSPPVLHADVTFVRSGAPGSFQKVIESTMASPYTQCEIVDHYGPNVPNEPDLRTTKTTTSGPTVKVSSGCAQSIVESMKNDDLLPQPRSEQSNEVGGEQCFQLNGVNLYLDNMARVFQKDKVMDVSDVKVQFETPPLPCDPCDVAYSVSAKIEVDEYIAVGFKGRSWERDFPYAPEHPLRPCYFGMCVDSFDNFTSDRIALAYTGNGGCVREMVAENIIGAPSDADYKILKSTSVERSGDRTIMRFTVSQHWQDPTDETDGPFRIMWAIGQVTGGSDCTATIGYHSNHRGVAPLTWLSIGSTPCTFSEHAIRNSVPLIV